ncbi:MAG: hypothetical protein V3T17_16925 [Pseudomonadales bacterium]
MPDGISSTTTQTPPVQPPPPPPRKEDEVNLEQEQKQTPRAEAPQENERPEERQPSADERVGTQIDTNA